MEDIFDTIHNITGLTRYSSSEVVTPQNIVEDMVNLIPVDMFNPESKFLDPAVKSGRFLAEIYRRLMDSDAMVREFPDRQARRQYILDNQLYGFATSATAATIVRKQLYDDPLKIGNISYTSAEDMVKQIRGELGNMKFDVVIGNPPYNKDVYLDFVTLGHQLAQDYTLMITPAKWQAKGGEKNEKFRKDIVPYMSDIVFYPCAQDIFDIAEPGGVSYYLIGKDRVKKQNIKIVSKCEKISGIEERQVSEEHLLLFNQASINIVRKCGVGNNIISRLTLKGDGSSFLRSFYLHESFKTNQKEPTEEKKIKCYSGSNIVGYISKDELYTTDFIDKWKITQTVMLSAGVWADIPNYGINPLNKLGPGCVPIGSYPVISVFNTEQEADSFISFANCRLIRFLHYIGINATTETSEFWRYIPDPGSFDHIFTDEELYQKYNLTPEEINIIESVIKDRK